MTKPAIICDLDGTLASVDHRRPLVDPFCPSCRGLVPFGMGSVISDCSYCHGTGMKPRFKKDWHAFHSLLNTDSPVPGVRALILILHESGYQIVFTTGRPSNYRVQTEWWLREHLPSVNDYILFMRDQGDSRKDSIVKSEMYQNDIAPQYGVMLAIDDRPQVVETWRNLGIPTVAVVDPGLPPKMEAEAI